MKKKKKGGFINNVIMNHKNLLKTGKNLLKGGRSSIHHCYGYFIYY